MAMALATFLLAVAGRVGVSARVSDERTANPRPKNHDETLVSASRAQCWLSAPLGCRAELKERVESEKSVDVRNDIAAETTSETEFPQAFERQSVERVDADTAIECVTASQMKWIRCTNAPLEPIAYSFTEAVPSIWPGSQTFPSAKVRTQLRMHDASPLKQLLNHRPEFPWAMFEFTQYGDVDLIEGSEKCPPEWAHVRNLLNAAAFNDGLCDTCAAKLEQIWNAIAENDLISFPMSGSRSDCFLGVFSAVVYDFLCNVVCSFKGKDSVVYQVLDVIYQQWHRLQSELEGLLFIMKTSMITIAMSGWPVMRLLRKTGQALRLAFGEYVPNMCDLFDVPATSAFRRKIGRFAHELLTGANFTEDPESILVASLRFIDDHRTGCPFGSATAIYGAIRAAQAGKLELKGETGYFAIDTLKAFDAMAADMVGNERRYFYDLLTTHWPWLELLEIHPGQIEVPLSPRRSCEDGVRAHRNAWWHAAISQFNRRGRTPLAFTVEQGDTDAMSSALCKLEGVEVLFISGTSSGYKWGSFTVRGRQAARGLRQVRSLGLYIKARTWNSDCSAWCDRRVAEGPGFSDPFAIVHVKYPCKCAIDLAAGAKHVYDPVDQFALIPRNIDAILGQTSIAAEDYANHPSVRDVDVRVYWHPLHHSNFRNISAGFNAVPNVVGVHTTHNDTELFVAVKESLGSLPHIRFEHVDPVDRFKNTGGHVFSPQQTDEVMQQMSDFDISVLRNAGCMSHLNCETTRSWFCARYKTGQRLVNAFSLGIPTVLWGEQGFLDVIEGSDYPAVAWNITGALHWIHKIAEDSELRQRLGRQARQLAEPYDLLKQSARLALILADISFE